MNERILIVDDEPNVRLMMRLTLEHAGYVMTMVGDGRSAISLFENGEPFDLVIVDQRMPGLTGLQVLQKIRDLAPEVRVILATAFGTIDLALEAMEAGASDFLRKPFTADTLKTAVRSALCSKVEKLHAVPIERVVKEFTRTTINGFSFDVDEEISEHDEEGEGHGFAFAVREGTQSAKRAFVFIPQYTIEHTMAYIDSEHVPGGNRFWQAMAGEALANYLWQNADIPPVGKLTVEDLTPGLQRWLDAVMTVETKHG